MKTVLYISYDGMTDPLGQSQVLPYLGGLAKNGYEIHLVSFEKLDRYEAQKNTIRELCKESGINWHPQDYSNEGGLRKTIRQVFKMNRVAKYLHDLHNFDIVHCRSYISAIAGLKMKRKYGVKFVFDMRGFWADERVDGKLWSLKNPLYKQIYQYFKKKEKQFLQEADYVISLTENAKNVIRGWKLKHQPDIAVIPCCVDIDRFNPDKIEDSQKESLRKDLGMTSEDFILGYVGSIGTWYMLPEMLAYFKILKERKPNARFLFISGEKRENIIAEASKHGINEDDIVVRSVLYYEVPEYISLFDASIFFIVPTFSKKASSPTKQGEIMAMGVPIVCNSGVGDTDLVVNKYHSGILIDSFDEESYRNHIIDLQNFNKEEIISGAREYFSLEGGVEKYLGIYKKLDD